MKSNIFTRISLCLLTFTASASMLAMGGFYEPDPKVVTTEEKINHYLFYLTNHGLASITQQGLKKAVPELVERVVIDGARMLIPEVFGLQTPYQKRLVYLGIEGARQAVKFSATAKQYAQERGQKIKSSEAIKIFLIKKFIPAVTKSLVVDLMYHGGSQCAEPLLQQFGLNPASLTANPYSISGMIYQRLRASGHGFCSTMFDLVFGWKESA